MNELYDRRLWRGTLASGSPVEISLGGRRPPLTVWVNPAVGDTVRVEYRIDAAAPWTSWENGDVTSYSDIVFSGPISDLRFTRTSGSGTTSKYGVA